MESLDCCFGPAVTGPCRHSSVSGFQKGTGQISREQHTKSLSLGSFLVLVTGFHGRKIHSFG